MFRVRSTCSLRASPYQLPPELRTIFRPRPRLFHASPSRAFQIGESFSVGPLHLAYGLLQGVHYTTGLPWGLAIPAVAILVRTFIVYPCFTLPMRRARQKQMDLIPLEQAYGHAMRRKYAADNIKREKKYHQQIEQEGSIEEIDQMPWTPKEINKKVNRLQAAYKNELWGKFQCQGWRTKLWIGQFGCFWTTGEAVGSMAGYKSTFLGFFYGPQARQEGATSGMESVENSPLYTEQLAMKGVTEESTTLSSSTDPAENYTPDIPNIADDNVVAQDLPEEPGFPRLLHREAPGIDAESAANPLLTPSLSDEGFLWFRDLAAPDPILLPIIVVCLTTWHIWSVLCREETRKHDALAERWRTNGATIHYWSIFKTLAFSGLLAKVTPSMPAGFLLYWASSTTWAMLQALYVEYKYPWRKPNTACERVTKEES